MKSLVVKLFNGEKSTKDPIIFQISYDTEELKPYFKELLNNLCLDFLENKLLPKEVDNNLSIRSITVLDDNG